MSTPLELLCLTCAIEFDFGALAVKRGPRIQLLEWFHNETYGMHRGHDLRFTNSDYWRVIADTLYFEDPFHGSLDLIAEQWSEFQHVSLMDDCAVCGQAEVLIYPPGRIDAEPITKTCLNSDCRKSALFKAGQCCITVKSS